MEPKILLIDDSAILRRIATNVLSTRAGCGEVVTATRATEGFALACASGMGLILVDYQLAGYPGAELCRRLLDEPRTSRVPVVLLLGRGMTPSALDTLPGNIVDFLVKPFTPEQLVSTVQAVFEAAKSGGPVRRRLENSHQARAVRAPVEIDRREVAAAVSAVASARRETNRVQAARTALSAKARVTVVARDTAAASPSAQPGRLRSALGQAMAQRQTGVLRVRTGSAPPTELYVENGQIVVVTTKDTGRYVADAEGVLPPKVSPAILVEAVSEQERSGVPFFLTLGSRGLLSKTTAVALLHRFGQQHFARLWTVPPASLSFEFTVLDALPGFALRLDPRREGIDDWLLETLRHVQSKDVTAFARQEGYAGTAAFRKNGETALHAMALCEQERQFGRQVAGCRDLPSIGRALGATVEHAYLLLFRFRCLEIMEYRPAASAFVVTPRTNVRRVLPLQR